MRWLVGLAFIGLTGTTVLAAGATLANVGVPLAHNQQVSVRQGSAGGGLLLAPVGRSHRGGGIAGGK